MTITDQIRQHLYNALGYYERKPAPNYEEIKRKNWFPKALKLAKNRRILGFFRYGYFRNPKQPKYNRVVSAITRLKKYKENGNTEYLLDALNLCGIEFEMPRHPNAHFKAVDDGIHTKIIGE